MSASVAYKGDQGKKKKKQQRYKVKTGTERAASLKVSLLHFLKSTESKYCYY